jgi:hypothetical protein
MEEASFLDAYLQSANGLPATHETIKTFPRRIPYTHLGIYSTWSGVPVLAERVGEKNNAGSYVWKFSYAGSVETNEKYTDMTTIKPIAGDQARRESQNEANGSPKSIKTNLEVLSLFKSGIRKLQAEYSRDPVIMTMTNSEGDMRTSGQMMLYTGQVNFFRSETENKIKKGQYFTPGKTGTIHDTQQGKGYNISVANVRHVVAADGTIKVDYKSAEATPYSLEDLADNIRNAFDTASRNKNTPFVFALNSGNNDKIFYVVKDGEVVQLTKPEIHLVIAKVASEYMESGKFSLENMRFTRTLADEIFKYLSENKLIRKEFNEKIIDESC